MPQAVDKALPEGARERRDSPWGTSFVLALFMHAALFAGLFYVVQWTRVSDDVVYADLYAPDAFQSPSPTPRAAETKPEEPAAEPQPEQPPEPQAKPEAHAPTPEDIALEEERKKLEEKKREEERLAKEKAQKLERAKALARALQAEDLKKMDTTKASGVVASKGGTSAAYASRVIACVRSHLNFAVGPEVKPRQIVATYEVSILADGTQTGAPKLLKASGNGAFDIAAERAIRSCAFPPTETRRPERIQITFDPVEMKKN